MKVITNYLKRQEAEGFRAGVAKRLRQSPAVAEAVKSASDEAKTAIIRGFESLSPLFFFMRQQYA